MQIAMRSLLNITINFSPLNSPHKHNDTNKKHNTYHKKNRYARPLCYKPASTAKIESFRTNKFKTEALREKLQFSGVGKGKYEILVSGKPRRLFVVEGFNGIGGGGGGNNNGRINSETARVLGNLVLAILLTYLSTTGQLGWLLDAIVSLWLLAVLVPIIGIGAFLWWAGRDIVQSSCPNCGNEFQVFKSTLNDDLQLCPFCSQPFSVEGNKFVSEPVKFSNQSTTFGEAFNNFSPRDKKGKNSSATVVDVEAQIRDAE